MQQRKKTRNKFAWPSAIIEAQPAPAKNHPIDSLIEEMIVISVRDATQKALRGVQDSRNAPLCWLWDVGASWAEIFSKSHREGVINLCEEISILADHTRRGQPYQATGYVGKVVDDLSRWRNNRQQKQRSMTNVT